MSMRHHKKQKKIKQETSFTMTLEVLQEVGFPEEVGFPAEIFESVIPQDVLFDIREMWRIRDIKHRIAADSKGARPLKQFVVSLFGLGALEVGSSARR